MTPAEARSATYNALTAAGRSHDDALYIIRQMHAAAGSPVAAETAGEAGNSLPPPSPAPKVRSQREYGMESQIRQAATYGEKAMAARRKLGGRRKNPTYSEIVAMEQGTTAGSRVKAGASR